ncbi:MAG: DUF7684 family protein [Janthinobacterium lividum]
MPSQDWLCVLWLNATPTNYLDEVFAKIIGCDVCYVCCIGKQCELAHDLLDEEIVYREVEEPPLYLPKHSIMTTWHDDLEEGLWFAIHAAHQYPTDINTVIILDMTGQAEKIIPHILAHLRH